jgi:hypothetical protein
VADGAVALGLGFVGSAFFILYETRSNTFFNDELSIFQLFGPGIDLQSIFAPHNGHLILPAHLVYAAVLSAAGPDYTILRVIGVLVFLTCCLLFFLLVSRRVGALLAGAATVVLLFLGSSWETLLWPLSMLTFVLALLFGLAALLALDRDGGIGDLSACVLTALAVVTHSVGIAFLVGVAVSVLMRGDRARRAWIFLIPIALYAAWWVWALRFHEGLVHAQNALLIAPFLADSLGAASAALTGLSPGFSGSGTGGFSLSWGPILALVAAVALALRIRRGDIPRSLWVALAIMLTFWIAVTLSLGEGRGPTASRYVFPDAMLVLVVAAEAVRGIRLPRTVVVVVLAVAAGSVLSNALQLRDGERLFRGYVAPTRADLGAIDIARNSVSPDFDPNTTPGLQTSVPQFLPLRTGLYLQAVARFGSFAFSPDELLGQPPTIQEDADRLLAAAEQLALQPASKLPGTGCTNVTAPDPFTPAARRLSPGSTVLEAQQPTHVQLQRFASDYPVTLADLPPGAPVSLNIPRDASTRPWRIALTGPAPVRVCTG